jgi:hypothetical protein
MVSCNAAAGTEVATIQVQITTQPLVGVLGGFTETGTQSAVTECGITQGVEC